MPEHTEVIEAQPEILPDQAQVVPGSVEITDRMKAEFIPDDKDAFIVQAIPTNPEQLISTIDTTRIVNSWVISETSGKIKDMTEHMKVESVV